MSEYPDEAPAFSSDEEPKNKSDNGAKKGANATKGKAATKDAPAKWVNQNHHDARVDLQGLPAPPGSAPGHR